MEFNESFIKNIIKNQKKFNYNSLPDVTLFADCLDKNNISAFEFYCKKGNEENTLKLLDVSNNKFYSSKNYHPFKDCCYNFLSATCEKMIEKNILPTNPKLLIQCFGYCLHSKMEKIAKCIFNIIIKEHPNEMNTLKTVHNGEMFVNPLHYSIEHNLHEIQVVLFDYYDLLNFDEFNNIDIFTIACKLNNTELINLLLHKYKINPFMIDNNNKYGLTYLLNHKNEEIILKVLEFISLKCKDRNFNTYLTKNIEYIKSCNMNKLIDYLTIHN
jgi:hypothetical protein